MGVLNVAHESLVTDLPTTKRDMFYQDVGLFGSQREVDQLTDDLAATFQLDRSDLNIRASGKGLLCGDGLKIVLGDGSSVSATNTDPVLIPQAEDIQRFELNHEIAWVLVVEKEAVFQTLCRLAITNHPSFPGSGVVVTGKGYPDVATRQLVATLSNNLPESVPIMVMVDGDAYGLDIASVYKVGSDALKHEAHKLVAERAECIGLFASELEAYGISEDAMLPTSKADEKKARAMLKRTKNLPDRWRRELEDMLRTHRKADIEVLSATTTAADLDLDQEDSQRSQKRVHPLVRYLSEKIAASVAALIDVQMKVEED
ncbi:DNA topoisomerase IV, alpha subunit [Peniophora sp. CONT]|nr:DNA topoisomerase IV, alpha subunit [Peniophora sp. CONT]